MPLEPFEPPEHRNADAPLVVVAMSGGVDSSVAAALLVEQGVRVVGLTMKTFCYSGTANNSKTCCGLEGILDARRVAQTLGIPHYVVDMEEAFTRDVIDDFVHEYAAGRTPNPCVRCNSNTKIPDLLRRARLMGAEAIATGHYARLEPAASAPPRLLRGRDPAKDQSYFLWGVPAEVLPALRFPVGHLTKEEVRERARQLELATADKPESQEICFVPTGHYGDFLAGRLGEEHAALVPGPLVRPDGKVVGEHEGYARYTVGQRRRLGGGRGEPLYVLGVRPERQEVVVGSAEELERSQVTLGDLNWLAAPPETGERLRVQVRHRARPVAARVRALSAERVELELEQPQRAVTPGQSGALYRDEQLIGGGRIR
ncbi:MAG: tRNA 2-thiouridine(34) synthase MnmA [Gemmatimonadota bacterium]